MAVLAAAAASRNNDTQAAAVRLYLAWGIHAMTSRGAALALGLALVAGCNISQSGANERLDFTPTECGYKLVGCNFADSIAVGGTIEVQIAARDGGTTTGIDLATDTPDILAVERVPGSSPRTWQVTALGAGVGRLAALDEGGEEVDFLEVPMQVAVGLGLDKAGGRADG